MVDFYHYPAQNFSGEKINTTIASGPIIMNDAGKFLLHISSSTGKYQFIGGRLDDTKSPQENAVYRAQVDLNLVVTLYKNSEPFVVVDTQEVNDEKEIITLIHYLATLAGTVTEDETIGWFSIEQIEDLVANDKVSSANVLLACRYFAKEKPASR